MLDGFQPLLLHLAAGLCALGMMVLRYWLPIFLFQIYTLRNKYSTNELLVAWEPALAFHYKILPNSAISPGNTVTGTFPEHWGRVGRRDWQLDIPS